MQWGRSLTSLDRGPNTHKESPCALHQPFKQTRWIGWPQPSQFSLPSPRVSVISNLDWLRTVSYSLVLLKYCFKKNLSPTFQTEMGQSMKCITTKTLFHAGEVVCLNLTTKTAIRLIVRPLVLRQYGEIAGERDTCNGVTTRITLNLSFTPFLLSQ